MKSFNFYCKFIAYFICSIFLIPNSLYAQNQNDTVRVRYTYPSPNATHVSSKTTIGVRYSGPIDKSSVEVSAFSVVGSRSGKHTGNLKLIFYGRMILFTPENHFSSGERVYVNIKPLRSISGQSTLGYSFSFRISGIKTLPNAILQKKIKDSEIPVSKDLADHSPWLNSGSNISSDTLPADFPAIYITKNDNPAPGNIYLDNFKYANNDNGNFLLILDNQGNILFERSTWPAFATDFKPQPNGMLTYFDALVYKFYGMDSNFVVDSFEAANGYSTDSHELRFLPDGGYVLLAVNSEQVDMSKIISNGDSDAMVLEGIIQEFDKDKNLVFEWRSLDHFQVTDAVNENLFLSLIDFTHCNAIEFDDTSFLLSSRHLDEITKIDREDGHIDWRWGGKNNEFTFINDSLLFSHQHAIRRWPNGNLTMFDNGNLHNTATPKSRAVEYILNENTKIATKVWEYHHDPDVFGNALGYVQKLENGNTLICWGGCDSVAVTEVKPDGSTALEIKFDPGIYTYRAYKYPHQQVSANVTQVQAPFIALEQNYPNPFTTSSVIRFKIDEYRPVTLTIYDALGREIKKLFDSTVEAGEYSIKFDAGNLANGAYICKLSTPSCTLSRTMILSK